MADRRYIGRKSHKKGSSFEKRILDTCDLLRKLGKAEINKANESLKPISGRTAGGYFKAVYTAATGADFSGVIKGGRAIFFEAKYTETDKITESRVTNKQINQLLAAERMGAVCFILCGFSSGNSYKVPVSNWLRLKELYGHKHVTESDIAEYICGKEFTHINLIDEEDWEL